MASSPATLSVTTVDPMDMPLLRTYASITKPGIIMGNSIAVIGGYFLGAPQHWSVLLLLTTALGIALVIGSAGALNNVIDKDIDALMERTKDRALAKGLLSPLAAGIFASILGLAGIMILWHFANALSAGVAAFGFFAYVVLYSLGLKRTSVHGTLVGSISGAVPPVVGYTAVAGVLDTPALLLALALVFWQMPHSYAIGIFRSADFKAAKIPLFSLLYSQKTTTVVMSLYVVLFSLAALSMGWLGYAGLGYTITMAVVSVGWLLLTLQGFRTTNATRWARLVFIVSILVVTTLSLALVFNAKSTLG